MKSRLEDGTSIREGFCHTTSHCNYRFPSEFRPSDGWTSDFFTPALKGGVTSNIALQATCCFSFDKGYSSNIALQATCCFSFDKGYSSNIALQVTCCHLVASKQKKGCRLPYEGFATAPILFTLASGMDHSSSSASFSATSSLISMSV